MLTVIQGIVMSVKEAAPPVIVLMEYYDHSPSRHDPGVQSQWISSQAYLGQKGMMLYGS